MHRLIKAFLSLISFMTIIPTKVHDVELAARYFYLSPLVGLIRGLIVAFATVLTYVVTNDPFTTSIVVIVVHMIIQGFNHIDGFIDFSEAMLSGKRGYDALKVVKDTYRGSFAIASFSTFILVSLALINYAVKYLHNSLLLVVPIATSEISSSTTMFLLATMSRLPNYRGLGSLFISSSKGLSNLIRFMVVVVISISPIVLYGYIINYFTPIIYSVLVTLVISSIISSVVSKYLADKVIGFTQGDVLGFSNEVSWITYFFVLALLMSKVLTLSSN